LSRENIPAKTNAWIDLNFVDLNVVKRSEIARSHEDILESSGLVVRPLT